MKDLNKHFTLEILFTQGDWVRSFFWRWQRKPTRKEFDTVMSQVANEYIGKK